MKRYLILFFASFLLLELNSAVNNNNYDVSINRSQIAIGEKITLQIKIYDIENTKVLWEELSVSVPEVEIYKKLEYYKNKICHIDIIFSVFKPGEYTDLFFEVPVLKYSDGSVLYVKTRKLIIKVKSPLTEKEIESIKNIADPGAIEIKKEKDIAFFPFYFSFYAKIIIAAIIIILLALIAYHFFHKYFIKGKFGEKTKLLPYEKFLADLEKISFKGNDSRIMIEKKISELNKAFKELVCGDFRLNVLSETTNELIGSLRQNNISDDIIFETSKVMNAMDLVKFAKASADIEKLNGFYKTIRNLGESIHAVKTEEENKINQERNNTSSVNSNVNLK